MDYQADIRIDETALDLEWLDQPKLMMFYTGVEAKAKKRLDEARESLTIIRAELDFKIRQSPADYNLDKVTETSIGNCIVLQDEYKDAQTEVIECQYEVNMAIGAVRSFDHRKTALENLVKLYGQQYFAGPKVPRDIFEERLQRVNKEQADIDANAKIAGQILLRTKTSK